MRTARGGYTWTCILPGIVKAKICGSDLGRPRRNLYSREVVLAGGFSRKLVSVRLRGLFGLAWFTTGGFTLFWSLLSLLFRKTVRVFDKWEWRRPRPEEGIL